MMKWQTNVATIGDTYERLVDKICDKTVSINIRNIFQFIVCVQLYHKHMFMNLYKAVMIQGIV